MRAFFRGMHRHRATEYVEVHLMDRISRAQMIEVVVMKLRGKTVAEISDKLGFSATSIKNLDERAEYKELFEVGKARYLKYAGDTIERKLLEEADVE